MGRTPSPIPLSDIDAIGPYFTFTTYEAAEVTGWLTVRALLYVPHGLCRMI